MEDTSVVPDSLSRSSPARTWAEMLALPMESQCLEIAV
jgi:hypothetical protein